MMKPDVWEAYVRLGKQYRGETGEKVITEADFVQERRLGNSTVMVVYFDALPGQKRPIAEGLYDLYESAVKRSDTTAMDKASKLFSERVGYSAEQIYHLAHAEKAPVR